MSSVKAAKMMKSKVKRGKVHKMILEHAAKHGTFISRPARERVPHPHGMYPGPEPEEKDTVHPSMTHALKHIRTMMSGAEPGQDMDSGDEANETSEPAGDSV